LKRKKMSLRSRIIIYILFFATCIIAILWLFQVVFLDDFYRAVKTGQIKSTASDMEKYVEKKDHEGLQTYLYNLDYSSDYCALVFEKNTNTNQYELVVSELQLYEQDYSTRKVCTQNGINQTVINKLLFAAADLGGSKTEVLKQDYGLTTKSDSFTSMNYGKLFDTKEGENYFVFVSGRLTPIEETVSTLQRQLLIITGVLILLSFVIAYIIGEITSKPIHKTNEKAKKLAEGKLDIYFDGKGYLEIDELNDTLNYAVEQLSKVETLRNELIANMSHDLRTPLTMIEGYGEVIRDLPNENTKENIQVIIDETKRLTNLVNNILDLSKLQSKNEELKKETFNLSELMQNSIARLNKMIEKDDYKIILDQEKDVYVCADHDKLNQVIYNIVGNALHYTGKKKKKKKN